jgi:hypothetical protein
MVGLRVGVEVEAPAPTLAAAMATLPWMAPECIDLDQDRSLLLLSTSFRDPESACGYAMRRVRRSADAIDLPIRIISAEAFPPVIDVRPPHAYDSMPDGGFTTFGEEFSG